ncbi:hypothetical protein DIPPA_01871 [Diplonema papillatum]|nr:hypothetical protein DIPPA_01871 [Diplonema papillatum]
MPTSRSSKRSLPPTPVYQVPTIGQLRGESNDRHSHNQLSVGPPIIDIMDAVDDVEETIVENIIVRFPKEQVEELVSYLIMQLMEQGLSDTEASEKAAELLDDPAAQLVMAKELNKPVLSKLLMQFYENHDPERLRQVEGEVNNFTGRTEDLMMVLADRYQSNSAALSKLDILTEVIEEEREWMAVTERSHTANTSRRSSSTPVVEYARRFLVTFFGKYDEKNVGEVDSFLGKHRNDLVAVQRELCKQYGHIEGALLHLSKMKLEPTTLPVSTRQGWFAMNAKLGRRFERHHQSWSVRLAASLASSAAYRGFIALWLILAAVFQVCLGIQVATKMLLVIFSPADGSFTRSVAVLCCFWPFLWFWCALLHSSRKAVSGWCLFTDEQYYGGEDFSLKKQFLASAAGPPANFVPSYAKATLPPHTQRTILMLPSNKYVRRHHYIWAFTFVFCICPLVYSVARCVVEGRHGLEFIAFFSFFNVVAGIFTLACLWGLSWCLAVSRKSTCLRAHYEAGQSSWLADPAIQQQFGLVADALKQAVALILFASIALFVPFWAYSSGAPSISPREFSLVAASSLLLLSIREVWRSPSLRPKTAPYVAALWAAYAAGGALACTLVSTDLLLIFTCLLISSQGMFLKAETQMHAEKAESHIVKAVERMAHGQEVPYVDEATPLKCRNVNIVDLALLNQLAYHTTDEIGVFHQSFGKWFNTTTSARTVEHVLPNNLLLDDTLSANVDEDADTGVSFLFFNFRPTTGNPVLVVVVQSQLTGKLLSRDLVFWSEDIFMEAVQFVLPFVEWWSGSLAERFRTGIQRLSSVFEEQHVVHNARSTLRKFLDEHADTSNIVVTGHGVAAGYARILAADLAAPAVVFSAPRASRVHNASFEVSVAADRDVFANIGERGSAEQVLDCPKSLTAIQCTHMLTTVQSLVQSCDDKRSL